MPITVPVPPDSGEAYDALVKKFTTDPTAASVKELVAQIRLGWCPTALPDNEINLDAFAALYSDHYGLEELVKSDEEGFTLWRRWKDSYVQERSKLLVQNWQTLLKETGVMEDIAQDIEPIDNEDDYGVALGVRVDDIVIALTTRTHPSIMGGRTVHCWELWEITYTDDASVGLWNVPEWNRLGDKTYPSFLDAATEATAQVAKTRMHRYLVATGEAAFDETERLAEQALAESKN